MAETEILYALGLSLWLGVTIVRQFRSALVERLTGWDVVGVIPIYCFFAPFPGRYDYHVLVRYQVPDGNFSHWFEVGAIRQRSLSNSIFNPQKRIRKALFDVVTELAHDIKRQNGKVPRLMLSSPYLALLLLTQYFVQLRLRMPSGTPYQFMVLASSGWAFEEAEPLMLSFVHRIDD